MDEARLSPKHPLLRRLGTFAVAHFSFSILASLFSARVLSVLYFLADRSMFVVTLAPLILMVLYLPLGLLAGWLTRTPVKTLREAAQATALEAGIAWYWAAMVLIALFSIDSPLGPLGLDFAFGWLATVTFLLAFPSCILVILGTAWTIGLWDVSLSPFPHLIFWAFPAGLLPPLLFNLGCLWAPKRQALPPDQRPNEQKEDSGP